MRRFLIALAAGLSLAGCAAPGARLSPDEARRQVMAAERAFAKTMADRDHRAFATFVADDTVFFSGPTPLRGKQAVVAFWARFYDKPQAPFSWEPEEVEVLDSGTLAIRARARCATPRARCSRASARSGGWSPPASGAWCSTRATRSATA